MNKLYSNLNENAINFYCYSINLYRFLKNNGLRYEAKFTTTQNKTCWIFKRTPIFEQVYQQFAENKNEWRESMQNQNLE